MEFGNDIGSNSGAIWVTAVALIIFGYFYNRIIDYLHCHGYNDGLAWLEVVVGVAVTVAIAGFTVGWTAVLLLMLYFACSGLFMAGGDLWRYIKARKAENGRSEE